jgi:pilus assembly protein CpaD
MSRFRNTAALILLGVGLTGCLGTFKGMDQAALNTNRSLYPENQPVVERTNFAFDVATAGSGVVDSDVVRLTDWFDSLQLRYGDRISVDDPSESRAVRADVARVAGAYGILLSDGSPVTPGSVQPGTARVIVTRSVASVPSCQNWRQAKLQGAPISTSADYGCAINSNLAAMIANPEDLVLGQEGSASTDPATASKAIRTYRNAKPTGDGGLQAVSTTGGN